MSKNKKNIERKNYICENNINIKVYGYSITYHDLVSILSKFSKT